MHKSAPAITVVVPCFNEEEAVAECHQRLTRVLTNLNTWYEIVYVDDGSRDGTLATLQALHASDSNVSVVELSRNFGHQTAVTAGLDIAKGDVVVIIDADLQDPPELIAQMLQIWGQGYEVVYGIRETRQGETAFKLWTARLFYRLINNSPKPTSRRTRVISGFSTGRQSKQSRACPNVIVCFGACVVGSAFANKVFDMPVPRESLARRNILCERCSILP